MKLYPIPLVSMPLLLTACISTPQYIPQVTERQARCNAMFASSTFDPIRERVELRATNNPPSKSIFPDYPSKSELPVLREFIALYFNCNDELGDSEVPVLDQLYNLYTRKITWGEFTNRRYAIINGKARQLIAESNARHQGEMERQRMQFQQWLQSWQPKKKLITRCNRDLTGSYTCETSER